MNRQNSLLIQGVGFCFLFSILFGCSSKDVHNVPSICMNSRIPCLQGKAIVKVKTNRGNIFFELDGNAAPITAGNFVDLVNRGVYKRTIFHRVIKKPEPFVVQGGDPLSNDSKIPANEYGTGSFIDPRSGQVRFIPMEMKLKVEDSPRYNRIVTNPIELSHLQLSHVRGAVAMARSEALDSASAQFYIALKPLPELDGRYSVFGRVVKGMDVVESIKEGDMILDTLFVE